ncbi:MAG: MMPL family transporter [Spirochaetales bacterium]|nr:MMPL family transporter [Spirochaetales bacterium]
MDRLFRFPVLVILFVLAVTAFFAVQLGNIEFDNDITNFIPQDNPVKLMKNRIDGQFGEQYRIVLGLELEKGTVFDRDKLLKIHELTAKLKESPVYDDVLSIASLDLVLGNDGGMSVEPLFPDDFTGSETQIAEIKTKLMSWDQYLNALVSEDFRATQIIISKDDEDNLDADLLYGEAKRIMEESDLKGFNTYLAGAPAVSALLSRNMKKDLALLVPIVILVVAIILLLAFRRISGVLLPLVTVLLSTIWTVGLMALLHVKLSMIATVIPVLMIAVGSAYGIHIVTHYYDDMRKRKTRLSGQEYRELVFACLRKIGPSVILAGLTTIAGFGSLSFSKVRPMQTFGIFSAAGVLAALIVSLLLIPALLLIRRPQPANGRNGSRTEKDGSSNRSVYTDIISRKTTVLTVMVLVVIASIFASTLVVTDNNLVRYFKSNTEIVRADAFLNRNFTGINTMTVVIEGSEKGALLDPGFLHQVSGLGDYLKTRYPGDVGEVFSFADLLRRMNKVMHWDAPAPLDRARDETAAYTANPVSAAKPELNKPAQNTADASGDWDFSDFSSFAADETAFSENSAEQDVTVTKAGPAALDLTLLNEAFSLRNAKYISAGDLVSLINRRTNFEGEAFNEIPLDPEKYGLESIQDLKDLIAQYLLLYSGSTDSLIDDSLEPQKMKITIQLRSMSSLAAARIKKAVLEYTGDYFPEDKNVLISGIAVIGLEVTRLITQTQTLSILISLFLVFLILLIYFRSFAAGLIGIVPLSVSIMINFAVMGIFGIRLDVSTAMIASIAIGIGIDYTIHFLSTYREERRRSSDELLVCRKTIATTGKAIIFNAVSVGLGFAVLLFSRFNPLVFLGLLIMLIMGTSSMAALVFLPVLLRIFRPAFVSRPAKQNTHTKEI